MLIELVNGKKLCEEEKDVVKVIQQLNHIYGFSLDKNSADSIPSIWEEKKKKVKEANEKCWQFIESNFISPEIKSKISDKLFDLIKNCLLFDPRKRPTASQLLEHDYFQEYYENSKWQKIYVKKPFLESSLLPDSPADKSTVKLIKKQIRNNEKDSVSELYHLWKFSSSTFDFSSLSNNLIIPAPIHRLPTIVRCSENPLNLFLFFLILFFFLFFFSFLQINLSSFSHNKLFNFWIMTFFFGTKGRIAMGKTRHYYIKIPFYQYHYLN